MRSLEGKTALVTGGGLRVGKAISLALAQEGVNLAIHYPSDPDETKEILRELSVFPVSHWILNGDFAKPAEYGRLIIRTLELTGRLDIVVNNASIFEADTLENAQFGAVMKHLEINAWAPFVLLREFARLRSGSVVNILDSRIADYDWAHTSYILSKRTLAALTEMSAVRFAPRVTVNAVAPGLILPPAGKPESYLNNLAKTVPLQRHGDPGDVAAAVLYLLKNDFMTGQVLYVDGGRHLKEYDHGPDTHQ